MWPENTQLHAHRQSNQESRGEKVGVLRAELNTTEIYICYVMWNCILYDVECLWSGWTTECEVVQNGLVMKNVWYEMVV